MVTNVTSLTGNGLKDWLIQRITAIYFAGYGIFLIAFFLIHPDLNYEIWHALLACLYFKIATVMALAAFSLHAWIGLWTVTTDYLSCLALRLTVQVLIIGSLISQFTWGLLILWRV